MPILDQGFITETSTSWMLGVTLIIWMLWDYFAFKDPKRKDTISEYSLKLFIKRPIVTFIIGAIAGHVLWFQIVNVVLLDLTPVVNKLVIILDNIIYITNIKVVLFL